MTHTSTHDRKCECGHPKIEHRIFVIDGHVSDVCGQMFCPCLSYRPSISTPEYEFSLACHNMLVLKWRLRALCQLSCGIYAQFERDDEIMMIYQEPLGSATRKRLPEICVGARR